MAIPQTQTFLCHNSKDKLEVEKIRDCLENNYGIKTFMDKYDFEVFKPWKAQLEEEISRATTTSVFLGRSGLGPVQTKEIKGFAQQSAEKKDFRIGLVILPSCPNDLTLDLKKHKYLGERNWVDFRQATPDPVRRLVEGILGVRSDFNFSTEDSQVNKKLRVELFEMSVQKITSELEHLYEEVRVAKLDVDRIEQKILEKIKKRDIQTDRQTNR